ncbi:MAG: fused MFS/spermidine synthase [Deltaproteobacteria bacterium]|nr:fused MFS/spermidine synthase [Deltaproteobacteria bacterium]
MIYGLNTVGAALGSFLSGYLLLQTLGVSKTNVLAGLINLMVALAALAISRQTKLTHVSQVEDTNRKEPERVKIKRQRPGIIPLTIACFGISGFVSMAYEVMWLRYSLFSFRDTIHLYTGIIAIFVLGIGIGSLVCRWIVNRVRAPVALFGFLQLGIGLSTILAVYLPITWYQTIFEAGERSGGYILLHLFVLLIIPAVLMGATFPLVTKIITTELRMVGNQVGRAYALNTAGSICGSLAAGFFLFPVMGLQATLYLLFGLNMIMATVLIAAERTPIRLFMVVIPLSLCVLFPVSLEYGLESQLPELIVQKISNKEEILEISEGITGTTWATKSIYSKVALIENSVVISREGSGSFLTHGYIPLLLTPEIPRSVLGLCFGGGLSYYAGRLFPEISRFDFVDISKKNMDLGIRHFPQNRGLKDDPRVRFIIDDAYNFIKYTDNKYNLILMEPTPPTFGFRNAALYTREFYELARERLTEDGYFSQVVPIKDLSYLESMSVMKTFASAFNHCLLWWNGFEPVMIGSSQEFRLDTRKIRERLNRPLIQNSLKEISGQVGYNSSGNFLSGLLLTTEDFRKVAAVGTVCTNDLNRLEYSAGREYLMKELYNMFRRST